MSHAAKSHPGVEDREGFEPEEVRTTLGISMTLPAALAAWTAVESAIGAAKAREALYHEKALRCGAFRREHAAEYQRLSDVQSVHIGNLIAARDALARVAT